MTTIGTTTLPGLGGNYTFYVYTVDTPFRDVGAIYAFTSYTLLTGHRVLYIGQAEKLGERISCHERWPDIRRHGANAICVLQVPNALSRDHIESDLIAANDPPLNKQQPRRGLLSGAFA